MQEWNLRVGGCLLALLLSAPAVSFAASPSPLIPLARLFSHSAIDPQVSPDGRRLAYLTPTAGLLNVWVRTLGKGDDRQITSEKFGLPPPNLIQGPMHTFSWQEDSQHILYIRDRDGDGNGHLYQTNVVSGATRDLTPWKRPRATLIGLSCQLPDQALIGLVPPEGTQPDVYRLDLSTGALKLELKNPGDVTGWAADHRLNVRAGWTISPEHQTGLRLRSGSEEEWVDVPSWQQDAPLGEIAGCDEAGGVFVFGALHGNTAELCRVDSTTGEYKVVACHEQYDLKHALLNPQTGLPDAVWYFGQRIEWQVLSDGVRDDFARFKQLGDGNVLILSRNRDDTVWTLAYQSDTTPTKYFLYDRGSGELSALFDSAEAIEPHQLRTTQPICFQARDGLTIPGYLTLPECQPDRPLPMVVCVHGGPHRRDVWCYDPVVQWLANRGYAVLQVNFRGSSGYGRKFTKGGGEGQWGGRMQSDLVDAKRWAVEQGIADRGRVAILGRSYGGYAVLAALAFTPDEFACGVDICGPSVPLYHCGDLQSQRRRYRHSPLHFARQFEAPLLVIQGANDPTVPREHSDQMVAALRACDADVQYLVFPDEGHCFHRPANAIRLYSTIEAFLAEHLGTR